MGKSICQSIDGSGADSSGKSCELGKGRVKDEGGKLGHEEERCAEKAKKIVLLRFL